MSRYILILVFSLCFLKNFSNVDSIKEVNQKIETLNKNQEYESSILKLEGIISNPKSTSLDLYDAYFQKYLIYKGLFNYSTALNNLNLALEAGLQTEKKEIIEKQVRIERLFIHFDLLEFDKVEEFLKQIKRSDFEHLTKETEAFYVSILATMCIRAKEYDKANEYLEEAKDILLKYAPKHLPLIYRKKIYLHKETKEYDKAISNFEKGLYYARKYDVEVYVIAMYNDLSIFYTDIGDVKNALETKLVLIELMTNYDYVSRSGRLQMLEKELVIQYKENADKQANKILFVFNIAIIILLCFGLIMFVFYKKNRKKRLETELKNCKIQSNLDNAIDEINKLTHLKTDLNEYNLTERQREIIALVKARKTNKEIGNELFISENTVKYHLKVIYETLKINKRSEL